MNRKEFLGYGISAALGAAAGAYITRIFNRRRTREEETFDDFKTFFRVIIYSEEWLIEKEGQNSLDITKLFQGDSISSVNFCFSSSHFSSLEIHRGEEVIAKDITCGAGYVYISPREIGEVQYTFILCNKQGERKIILPVSFKDNLELMAAISDAEKNGLDDKILLEDYSKGYPRRALIDRKKEIEYQINGIEAIAETSPENLKEYFRRISDFKTYDDFLIMRRREETVETPKSTK